ncbi:MAG: hypothetical protein KIT11_10375 [Fimbriimonadaceae bacterium]|nr:hypothetical protein [Fimbriimonadaceae bacterium]QYK55727.1 MAG: hypothetical protein KF733_12045 [Fimbriimonadaceae bacterium]
MLSFLEGRRARLRRITDDEPIMGSIVWTDDDRLGVNVGEHQLTFEGDTVLLEAFAATREAEFRASVLSVDGGILELASEPKPFLHPAKGPFSILPADLPLQWHGAYGPEEIRARAMGPNGFAYSSGMPLPMGEEQEFDLFVGIEHFRLAGMVEYQRIQPDRSNGGVCLRFEDRIAAGRWLKLAESLTNFREKVAR